MMNAGNYATVHKNCSSNFDSIFVEKYYNIVLYGIFASKGLHILLCPVQIYAGNTHRDTSTHAREGVKISYDFG